MGTRELRNGLGLALGDYVQMLWHGRWVVLAVTIVAAALAVVTRPPAPVPFFRATVTLRVQTFEFTSGASSVQAVQGVPPAEIQAARSVEVAEQTARELGHTDGGARLLAGLSVSAQENSDLMQMSSTGEGERTGTELEAYAENYVGFRNQQDEERLKTAVDSVDERIEVVDRRLQDLSAQLRAGGASPAVRAQFNTVTVLYSDLVRKKELLQLDADLAGNQVELLGKPILQRLGAIPTRTLRLIAGPIVGLLLGAGVAIALGVLRPRVTGRDRTEERLGYPVLATVPRIRQRRMERNPLILQRVSGWAAEGIRMLRTELQLVEERGGRLGVVAVVSPEPRDGKSTIAANLAAAYAAAGKTTILVHADLRAARTGKQATGLTDYLSGRAGQIPIQHSAGGYDEVLPGARIDRGKATMSQDALVQAVAEVAEKYDTVVIDTPPLLAFADAVRIASEADAVVMVTCEGKTSEDRAAEALDVLIRHNAAVAGIVINAARIGRLERYRYRRYYSDWTEEALPPPVPLPRREEDSAPQFGAAGVPPVPPGQRADEPSAERGAGGSSFSS